MADGEKSIRPQLAVAGGGSDSDLLGREDELLVLRHALTNALSGNPQVVAICGEPGIGKTRLAREMVQVAATAGTTVRIVRCHAADASGHGVLTRAFELSGSSETPTQGDPSEDDLVAALMTRARSAEGLVLLVDDAQWADEQSLAALDRLARSVEDRPDTRLLMMLTVRTGTEQPNRRVEAIQRRSICSTLIPEPLNSHDTHDLLMRRGVDVTPAQAEEVRRATRGNPLSIDMAAGVIRDRPMILDSGAALDFADLGGTVRHRTAGLDPSTCTVLEALAIGGRASVAELAMVAGVSDRATTDAVAAARRRGLVERSGAELHLAHPLFAEALAGICGPFRRQRLHAAWFELLDRADDRATLGERAGHVMAAGELIRADRALAVLAAAGSQAFERHAMHTASRFLTEALRLAAADDHDTELDLTGIRFELGVAQIRSASNDAGIANLVTAADDYASRGDHRRHAEAMVELLSARLTTAEVGSPIDDLGCAELAERLEADEPAAAAWLWAELASIQMVGADFAAAERTALRAIAVPDADPRSKVRARCTIGVVRWNQLEMRNATDEFARTAGLVPRSDAKWRLEGLLREVLCRAWMGQSELAESQGRSVNELSAAVGYWRETSFAHLASAVLDHRAGRYGEAEARLVRARRDAELSQYTQTDALIFGFHIGVLGELDRTDTAKRLVDRWRSRQNPGSPLITAADLAEVAIDVLGGSVDDLDTTAERTVRAAAGLASFTFLGAESLASTVIAIAFHLDRPDLVGACEATVERAIAGGMVVASSFPADLGQARARAHWLGGRHGAAIAELDALVESHRRRCCDGNALSARADLARMAARSGTADVESRSRLAADAAGLGAWRLLRLLDARSPLANDTSRVAVTIRLSSGANTDGARSIDRFESDVRDITRRHGGRPAGRAHPEGGIVASFADPATAIAALRETNAAGRADGLGIRAGVGAGSFVERDENLFGEAVNLASRLASLAEPGSVGLCERSAAGLAEPVIEAGLHHLKGLERPVGVYFWSAT